ncbi:sodium:proton antiporter [Cryomorphaceae bacterium]|nr:sodium:proton antiporter [Cryomorphaceae bacterium]
MEGMLELASVLILGVFAQWLAWRIKQPAILPLIVIGLAVGPIASLFTPDGNKLLDGDAIFTGDLLFSFVSISVGVILFEGGLTLKVSEIRGQARTVRNLLIFGPIITLVGGALGAHYLLGANWGIAALFGALIIVSGPTVIMPILRNVRPNQRINTILKWEGILIDPLGALIAVLIYEFIQSGHFGEEITTEALKEFVITIATGVFVGGLAALFLRWVLRRNRLPEYLKNVFTLGLVIFAFTLSEMVQKEAGLMAATFMGIMLANMNVPDLKKILSFKEDVSLILISVLFILLSSRINMEQIEKLGWKSVALFGVVVLVVRPLVVFLSTLGSSLKWNERFFLSWIGPKGIVAAAVASLFSIQLIANAPDEITARQAEFILPLTFLMIVGTVVLQGSSAKFVARLLRVERAEPIGILIVGASDVPRFFARYLQREGVPVLVADVSANNIEKAQAEGLDTFRGDVLAGGVRDEMDLTQIGRIMAMTSNSEINQLATQQYQEEFGEDHVFRIATRRETELEDFHPNSNVLFSQQADYLYLASLIRTKPTWTEHPLESQEEFEDWIKKERNKQLPAFILKENGRYELLHTQEEEIVISKGDVLIALKGDEDDLDARPESRSI